MSWCKHLPFNHHRAASHPLWVHIVDLTAARSPSSVLEAPAARTRFVARTTTSYVALCQLWLIRSTLILLHYYRMDSFPLAVSPLPSRVVQGAVDGGKNKSVYSVSLRFDSVGLSSSWVHWGRAESCRGAFGLLCSSLAGVLLRNVIVLSW